MLALAFGLSELSTRQNKTERHHIVARSSIRALPARVVLETVYSDGVENPNNIVVLSYDFHRRIHNYFYYIYNGGVWKAASSVAELASKSTRSGTYDERLRRVGP